MNLTGRVYFMHVWFFVEIKWTDTAEYFSACIGRLDVQVAQRSVPDEASAQYIEIGQLVFERSGRRMNCQKAAALADELNQCLQGCGRYFFLVDIEHNSL